MPGAATPESGPPSTFQTFKKVVTTIVIPWGMVCFFLYTVASTLSKMYKLTSATPPALGNKCVTPGTGGTNELCEAVEPVLVHFKGLGYAIGTSGLLTKWGAAFQLLSFHELHYKILYAHRGSEKAQERIAAGDPPPLASRFGIDAGFELAGHHRDIWIKAFVQEEGYAKLVYMRLVKVVGSIFFTVALISFIEPGLSFALIIIPVKWILTKMATCLTSTVVGGAEKKAKAGTSPDAIQPLSNEDAVFYLMLEWTPDSRLEFTRDVDETMVPEMKLKEGYTTEQKFTAGATLEATSPLTYKALCDGASKIEVSWEISRDFTWGEEGVRLLAGGSGPGSKKKVTETVTAMVPVSAVAPVLSRAEARAMYDDNFVVFQQTGVMKDSWQDYFVLPLDCWLAETVLEVGGLTPSSDMIDFLTGVPYYKQTFSSISAGISMAQSLFAKVF